MPVSVKKRFSNLIECIAHIAETYAGEVTVDAKDRHSGEPISFVNVPAYLFRGESAEYESTMATMQRIPFDRTLTERARQLMPKLASFIEMELRKFLALSPMDSAGFAQHYGLPTELLDFTSNANVAGFFGSGGKPGEKGYVAVFPTKALAKSSQLIDLRNHDSADRPRRQQAFAVFHKTHADLKAVQCVADLESVWFGFTLTEQDKQAFQHESSILDAHTDPVAGALQLVIDSMVIERGKLPDEIARWLSKRIAPAPFVTRILNMNSRGQPAEVELVSPVSAGVRFNEKAERERSYRYWSSEFSFPSRSDA